MAHNTKNTESLIIENGQLVRIVNARFKDYSLDVLKEYEDGTIYTRNVVYSFYGYHLVNFPGEKIKPRYYSYNPSPYIQKLEDWQKDNCNMYCESKIPFDKEYLISKRPDLKYFFRKLNIVPSYCEILKLIRHYKKYPNIETLIEKGLYKLALNTNLQKLSKPKLNQVINFIKNNELEQDTMLKDILFCVKNNIDFADKNKFIYSNGDFELFNYLKRKEIDISYYNDYKSMCNKAGHDINDPYWKYPNDIVKAHNKVMEECENISKLNSKLKYDMLNEVLKDLYKYNSKINGYDVFVSADINIIQKQCDVLYQCLIRNDYIYKEIMQENILVFFWKDGNPIATAEVFYDGKVGQFYGDERDRTNCQASQELREILNIWLSKTKLKKRKVSKKITYYKGFYEKKDDTFIGFNNYEFKIGQTYETKFDDDSIIKAGASGCNASNKVFHFCDSIEEISRHYSPKYYCIVEPLGPVLDYDGALLSNKIKIIKEVERL